MKFLLDICVASRSLTQTLSDMGHDVATAYSIGVKTLDEDLLAAAHQSEQVLVTADRDFGFLIFVRKLPHGAVVRFVDMSAAQWCSAMKKILATHSEDLTADALITVTRGRVRIRR